MEKTFSKAAMIAAFSTALAGCVSTQEMPLAPNVVRLDTSAKGALFVSHAGDLTLQRAAQVTIQNGYQYFRLEQAQMGQGSQLVGASSFGNGTVYGNAFGATGYGSNFTTPMYAPTSEIGVTVVMFHAGDAGANGAFSAADVLKKHGSASAARLGPALEVRFINHRLLWNCPNWRRNAFRVNVAKKDT